MKLTRLIQTDRLQAVTRRISQRVAEEYAQEPGIKLSSAFLVVLILHVVAVGGIYAFNSIKAHKIVPAMENSTSAALAGGEKAAAPQPSVTGTPAKTHRVRAGETLDKIAAIYGLGAKDLEAANEIHNTVALRVGQELRIPARTASKLAAAPKSPALAATRKSPESDSKVVKELASKDAAKGTAKLVAKEPAKDAAKEAAKDTTKDAGDVYTVAKGDTPAGIARKLGVKQSDLLKLNKIDDPRKLQIGQKLHLPAKPKS